MRLNHQIAGLLKQRFRLCKIAESKGIQRFVNLNASVAGLHDNLDGNAVNILHLFTRMAFPDGKRHNPFLLYNV